MLKLDTQEQEQKIKIIIKLYEARMKLYEEYIKHCMRIMLKLDTQEQKDDARTGYTQEQKIKFYEARMKHYEARIQHLKRTLELDTQEQRDNAQMQEIDLFVDEEPAPVSVSIQKQEIKIIVNEEPLTVRVLYRPSYSGRLLFKVTQEPHHQSDSDNTLRLDATDHPTTIAQIHNHCKKLNDGGAWLVFHPDSAGTASYLYTYSSKNRDMLIKEHQSIKKRISEGLKRKRRPQEQQERSISAIPFP
jgi:hypothetical protein